MSIIDKLVSKFNEMFPDESDPAVKSESLIPYHVHVKMQDGTIEEYSGFTRMINGKCMKIDCSPYYHIFMSCPSIQEAERFGKPIYETTIKQANCRGYCPNCEEIEKRAEEEDE